MELLRELMRIQEELGFLDEDTLREISKSRKVPLYHLEGLTTFYSHFRREPPPKHVIHVCRDACCHMSGAGAKRDELLAKFADRDDVAIEETSCLGRCDAAPAAMIDEIPIAPQTLHDRDLPFANLENAAIQLPDEPTPTPRNWKCDPYQNPDEKYATVRNLASSQEELATRCFSELDGGGLRGMGGAGFPTGRKWRFVAEQKSSEKYVICNADESEPGTFKDRVILEELPHLVIEGMILAALTVGAERGVIFLRHEYTRERKALQREIARAYELGVLGENAAGSGRRFELEIFISPGGYILGEETAVAGSTSRFRWRQTRRAPQQTALPRNAWVMAKTDAD